MISLTIGKLHGLTPVVRELTSTKLPIKAAYKLARFVRLADEQLQDFEAQRIKLIEELGEKNEKGIAQVKEDKKEEFAKLIGDLLELPLEVDAKPISFEELGEDATFSAAAMVQLQINGIIVD